VLRVFSHDASTAPGREAISQSALYRHLDGFLAAARGKNLNLAVIGLGYVGLPLAEAFAATGFRTIGLDLDASKIATLASGRSYLEDLSDDRIAALTRGSRFTPTSDVAALNEADAFLICVPTPVNDRKEPDLTHVLDAARTLSGFLRPGSLVVVESTVFPGATEAHVKPVLEIGCGLRAGRDFALAYSPERVDPANLQFPVTAIPKVVGADSEMERAMATAVYREIVKVVPVSNMRTAEAVKALESSFRLVNIALVNELKRAYSAIGVDIWEAISAAATKPFGFMPFFPGPGVGGHCVPVDPNFVAWQARANGVPLRLIEMASEIAETLPRAVAAATEATLREHRGLSLSNARILVLGVAYKRNVSDVRESPALTLMEQLLGRGAVVDYFDPLVPFLPANTGAAFPRTGMRSIDWCPDRLSSYDCGIVMTDHAGVDYRMAVERLPLLIDTRNVIDAASAAISGKVVKA
jgi:UDP-N-acetyl-D-glucosamine dehydrogenase